MNNLVINTLNKISVIDKNIYGHFSEHLGRCIYEGLFVPVDSKIPNTNGMRNDVVAALKELKIPVLRWPGGCFADEYHWKDGIGPKENRKRMINTHWGGVVEDNSFGTHEFLELCEQVGCEPYINGNLGSGTVAEMQEWVEYITFDGVSPMAEERKANGRDEPWKLKYFGVGNENWGCGGNMRPEHYADEYRRYQTYLRNFSTNKLYKIACGANSMDYRWTEVVMEIAGRYMHGLSLHYYTVTGSTWNEKGSATEFTVKEYFTTLHKALKIDTLIEKHSKIMDKYDPDKKVGLIVDEWGTWHNVEPGTNPGFLFQQNAMRDALVAGVSLNIFNKRSDRVKMANIAQLVNVLQSVILTEGEKMLLTPTYHVFNMYKYHQDAELVGSYIESATIGEDEMTVPNLHESVSVDSDGVLTITVCNLDNENPYEINTIITGLTASKVDGTVLTAAMDAHNTFENPETVKPCPLQGIELTDRGFKASVPSCSVALFRVS